jgi:hypothetical protein
MIQKSLVEREMRGFLAMRPFVTVFAEDRALNRCTVRAHGDYWLWAMA